MRRVAVLCVVVLLGVAASPRRTYQRDVEDWTRKLVVYRGFSTALILRATLREPAFRALESAERARLLAPTADDDAGFRRRMAEDGDLYHELVLSAGDGVPGKLRFGPGDDAWNLRLEVDGTVAELVTVYEVDEPTPLHLALYPHHNQWSQMFIARFHRTAPAPDTVTLHVGSGWGNGTLAWSGLGSQAAPGR